MNDVYAIYLRKSRADLEAEARGEGETLARHRHALTELANQRGYRVVKIYEEIVSGDTIASRPQVQALLDDVQNGAYAGVIVNDIDRLARGDGIDQEIVKQTFMYSDTAIITPYKIYDLGNQSDEDQIEFKLFMGRFEYKAIKRRLQMGRTRSALEGNFISSRVPYGYKKVHEEKRIRLEVDQEQAEIVRMIFNLYAYGENGKTIGYMRIATILNEMGLKTNLGNPFGRATVKKMLLNPIYAGDYYWGKQKTAVVMEDGKRKKKLVSNEAPYLVEDSFSPIVDRETFDIVQRKFKSTQTAAPVQNAKNLVNPLSGLVRCVYCGKAMQLMPDKHGERKYIKCPTYGCKTHGTNIDLVERLVMDQVEKWKIECEAAEPDQEQENPIEKAMLRQRETLTAQMDRLHDLVEQGAYTVQDFVKRRAELQAKLEVLEADLQKLQKKPSMSQILGANSEQIKSVADGYKKTDDVNLKNAMLKSIIDHIDFDKTVACTKTMNPEDYLTLTIYPRLL